MMQFETLDSWDPAVLLDVATSLSEQREQLLAARVQFEGARPPEGMPAPYADQLHGSFEDLAAGLDDKIDLIGRLGDAARAAGNDLLTVQATARRIAHRITRIGWTFTTDGDHAEVCGPVPPGQDAAATRETQDELAQQLTDALCAAQSADHTLATVFEGVTAALASTPTPGSTSPSTE